MYDPDSFGSRFDDANLLVAALIGVAVTSVD